MPSALSLRGALFATRQTHNLFLEIASLRYFRHPAFRPLGRAMRVQNRSRRFCRNDGLLIAIAIGISCDAAILF